MYAVMQALRFYRVIYLDACVHARACNATQASYLYDGVYLYQHACDHARACIQLKYHVSIMGFVSTCVFMHVHTYKVSIASLHVGSHTHMHACIEHNRKRSAGNTVYVYTRNTCTYINTYMCTYIHFYYCCFCSDR